MQQQRDFGFRRILERDLDSALDHWGAPMANRFGTRRVFASAIGVVTLGSFLCGICTNIHLLVVCRILQGCGGAMMLPVGRLTLVRTFAKSELIRRSRPPRLRKC